MAKSKGKKFKLIWSILGWFFTFGCGVTAISFFSESNALAGLAYLIVALLCCPILFKIVKGSFGKKGTVVQWVGIFAFMLMAGSVVPQNEETDSTVPIATQEMQNDITSKLVENNADAINAEKMLKESESQTSSATPLEPSASTESLTSTQNLDVSEEETSLEVHFIDVGQGDSTLVICDGHALLIDAGSTDKGTTVQLYLKKHNVESLDAVIWTHPDADHIGGADVITTKLDIGTIYMPSVTADTKAYEELIDAIDYRNYSITTPSVGSSFELGGATVTFLGPSTIYDDNDNNNSIVCMLQFGNNKFLFTGDAEEEAENALVIVNNDLSADVYKVGHHGSKTASSTTFLNAVNPTYAVISCGEDNTYGHPHSEVLNNLRDMGVEVFRTDEQGSIIATSDGTNITWNLVPSDTWQAGEASESSSTESRTSADTSSVNSGYGTAPAGAVYIGNTNNQKLHKASCSGLPQSQNQVLFDTLEAATAAGYTADLQCKLCKPYGEIEASASTSASVTKEASTAVTESTTSSVSTGSYIGNTNNQKLHKASCNSLPKPQNQVLFSSLDEAQAAGYTKDNQCKRCYPYGK